MAKSQEALSNLVQAEVAFMNYFEQITFWENYAFMPTVDGPCPSPANIDTASQKLQDRTKETMALLETHLEGGSDDKRGQDDT